MTVQLKLGMISSICNAHKCRRALQNYLWTKMKGKLHEITLYIRLSNISQVVVPVAVLDAVETTV